MKTSIRNVLTGTVRSVASSRESTEVALAIAGDAQLHAIISDRSADSLQLAAGEVLKALIREAAIFLCCADSSPAITDCNRLHGRIMRCCEGVVCAEVLIELDCGVPVTAMISFESLAELALWPGSPVWVCFRASDVMLVAIT